MTHRYPRLPHQLLLQCWYMKPRQHAKSSSENTIQPRFQVMIRNASSSMENVSLPLPIVGGFVRNMFDTYVTEDQIDSAVYEHILREMQGFQTGPNEPDLRIHLNYVPYINDLRLQRNNEWMNENFRTITIIKFI
ncbi:unnamed protein product [Cyprideis torosa]|uniref:Uncharacterized protein n=1 Tax=Cyprideis torosa TaxID=163714 RepID=A0A7R8ZQP3_9CRUS|nr:unnamed protein product [Cyprideis torosa]CAG0903404.1 unnamed protein product [Cyprideis torosa]